MSELLSVAENVSKIYNQFCIFCYKPFRISEKSIVFDKLLKQFCTSFERFTSVSHNHLLKLWPHFQNPCLQENLGICSQCSVLINEFCSQYHQLKCLELNLKHNLDKLAGIVKQANRIPERVRRIKCQLKTIWTDDGNQIGKAVSEFRDVLRQASNKLLLSEPRILLKRVDESCPKSRRTIITKSEISPNNAQELTLGWLLSFAVVTLLATATVTPFNHETASDSDFEPPEEDIDTVLSVSTIRNIGPSQSTAKLATALQINTSVDILANSEPDLESGTNETFFSDHHDDNIDDQPAFEQTENHHETKVDMNQISVARNNRHKCTLCSKSFKHVTTLRRHIKTKHSAKLNDRNSSTQKLFPCVFCKTSYITYRRYRAHVQLSASHEKLKKVYFQQQKLKRDGLVDKSESNSTTSKKRKVTKLTENRYNLRAKRMRNYTKVLAIDENEKETDADPEYNIASESSDSDELSSTSSDSEDYGPEITQVKQEPRQPATLPTKSKVNSNIPELKCKLEGCNLGFGQNQEKFQEHQKLHAKGNFKCNFCSQVCSSIVQLANHERTKHPPENIPVTSKRLFYCPRCSYESLRRGNYQRHFASKHLNTFDPKKGQERATCKICQSSVLRELLETHFQKFHDISNMVPEKVKRCSIQGCTAYFKSIEQRKIHRQKVHKTEKCRKILESTSEESDIDLSGVSEDEQIMPGNSFMCKTCKKTFQTLISIRQHKRRFHRKNVELSKPEKTSFGEFICPVMECIETFTSIQELQTHYKLHGNFKCQFCSLETTLATDLALHESNEHTDNVNTSTFKCSRCPIFYEKKFAFVRHFCKRHLSLSTSSQLCPICNAEGSKRYLQKHKEVHHNIEGLKPEDIWRCDLNPCQAYFVTSTQLKMRTHWNGKCPKCDYVPKQDVRYCTNKLKVHLERKHPEMLSHFKFRCTASNSCKQLFESQTALEKHIKIVHQIMQCSKCEKTFASKAKLTKHESTVHGQRNFVCNECGKAFSTKDNLQNHMEYHKDPKDWKFECETCQKRFAHGFKLVEHQRTHTKEKPYVCQNCGEKYAHRHNWRNHMKTKHPTEFQESGNSTRREEGIYVSRKGSKKGECLLSGGKS